MVYSWMKKASWIGLDVSDTFLRRKPALKRFCVWFNRHIKGDADIYIYTGGMTQSRDDILTVLRDRFVRYEIRSISEAKQLDSGDRAGDGVCGPVQQLLGR